MKPLLLFVIQVRKERPTKTPPRTTTAAEASHLRSLKPSGGKPQNREENESTGASRPCKWSQILGARGTVNPSQQTRETPESTEFHIDLNRFGSAACSNSAQTTPKFGNQMKFGRRDYTGTSTSQCDEPARRDSSNSPEDKPAAGKSPPPVATEGVLLWKRRSAKPMTLDLKKRVGQSNMIK